MLAVRDQTRLLVDQAALVPADAIEGMDPDVIAMSRAMKTPIVHENLRDRKGCGQ